MGEYAESRYALPTVAETVADGVRRMVGFVDTIEEIGLRMQRVALNANHESHSDRRAGVALGSVAVGDSAAGGRFDRQTQVVARASGSVADRSGKFFG